MSTALNNRDQKFDRPSLSTTFYIKTFLDAVDIRPVIVNQFRAVLSGDPSRELVTGDDITYRSRTCISKVAQQENVRAETINDSYSSQCLYHHDRAACKKSYLTHNKK